MKRRILTAMFIALPIVALSTPARGDVDPEIRGGLYTSAEKGFLGGGLLTGIAPTWYFNPNAEVVFADGEYLTLNADVHKDLNMGSGPAFWLGAGPALVISDTNDSDLANSEGDNDVDLGLNVFGGIGAQRGSTRPFGQLKYMISDQNQLSLALGLRF